MAFGKVHFLGDHCSGPFWNIWGEQRGKAEADPVVWGKRKCVSVMAPGNGFFFFLDNFYQPQTFYPPGPFCIHLASRMRNLPKQELWLFIRGLNFTEAQTWKMKEAGSTKTPPRHQESGSQEGLHKSSSLPHAPPSW